MYFLLLWLCLDAGVPRLLIHPATHITSFPFSGTTISLIFSRFSPHRRHLIPVLPASLASLLIAKRLWIYLEQGTQDTFRQRATSFAGLEKHVYIHIHMDIYARRWSDSLRFTLLGTHPFKTPGAPLTVTL